MIIKKVSVRNIKSYKELETIDLHDDVNIFVGANGSGKSNLLDIITVCMKSFFFKGVSTREKTDVNGFSEDVSIKNPNMSHINTILKKNYNCNVNTFVEFTFLITDNDIKTMEHMKNNYEKLKDISSKYVAPLNMNFFVSWDIPRIKNSNRIVTYKIENSSLSYSKDIVSTSVLQYMNNYELISYLTRFEDDKVSLNYIYFTPYRAIGINHTQASLNGQSYYKTLEHTHEYSSQKQSSLINLASIYFAEKMRNMECDASHEGYQTKWDNDREVQIVSQYLKRVGYSWELKLVNRNKNTYMINLKKNNKEYLLSDASSGEKEIINFLLGIFALNISNGVIVIDEPELHLHPKWQKILLDLLYEISEHKGCQIIISTHSGTLVNDNTYKSVLRVYTDEDNSSKVIMFKNEKDFSFKDILNLINASNNEKVFFADSIIMVEGITDKLIFNRLLMDIEYSKSDKVIELVEIKGKHNFDKYSRLFNALKIPYAFITDLDFLNKSSDLRIKDLFRASNKKIYKDVLKNNNSQDGQALVDSLESAINLKDLTELHSLWEYLKSSRRKLKSKLSHDENELLKEAILQKKENNIYVLGEGEIEAYFPVKYKGKALENVISLLDDQNYNMWKETEEYKSLNRMMVEILEIL